MLELILITDSPDIAKKAEYSGVDIIMVDLEIIGKQERQGGLNTIISNHTIDSIEPIKNVLDSAKLMVRINPLHSNSSIEIEEVISKKPDLIMVPMFKSSQELQKICEYIDGRCAIVPLLETTQALLRIDDILEIQHFEFIHLGLNDLRISLGIKFLFEVVSGGLIEYASNKIFNKGIKFGFGGVARMSTGELPGRLVISEHVRLNSSAVILSRAFHNNSKTIEELNKNVDLQKEIENLRNYENKYRLNTEDLLNNKTEFKRIVDNITFKNATI